MPAAERAHERRDGRLVGDPVARTEGAAVGGVEAGGIEEAGVTQFG